MAEVLQANEESSRTIRLYTITKHWNIEHSCYSETVQTTEDGCGNSTLVLLLDPSVSAFVSLSFSLKTLFSFPFIDIYHSFG